ncbi:hypothetical protein HYFRA_00008379 [Hymenoscyphus fraxineus]|uniref:amidase n=1 Tax=Hymenoscyphus fraxineus TaxID=746836 RepID=A0A9N9KLX8_9HELO|nr:hypothetical protein HYFRA_00008379 [Hymenoscyphus fraxineus]
MSNWEELVHTAQKHRDETISILDPPLPDLPVTANLPKNLTSIPRSVLSPEEIGITETPIDELLAALATGRLSSVTVTRAFLRRAGSAQRLVNCVFELAPQEALTRAKELDDFFEEHQKTVGPLHGLPVSVKALIRWKGLRTTEGLVAALANTATRDASILALVRSLGAVPFVRTTEPQGVMMLETLSPIHGSTLNPHNTLLTPGGSSGGEGALLALLASPLGLGTDIGGSVRSPAANCGIYTLKPSAFRLPLAGIHVFFSGCEMVPATVGPMSPSRKGIAIFMESVLATRPWERDPSLLPVPWRKLEDPFGPTLNIGVMWDDGVVKPSKAMTRALKEVVKKLEGNPRFRIERWEPFKHKEAVEILEKLYSPDGGQAFTKALAKSGEPMHELTDYRLVSGPGVESLSIQSYWDWTMARNIFRAKYLKEWLDKAPQMDVILCPPHPGAAPPIGTTKYWGYTSVWNLLDYPAAVFPVTRVDADLDGEEPNYDARSEVDEWTHSHFDAQKQAGAPVCLQLVGKRLEDEKVVQAMDEICEAAGLPFIDCLR